MIDIAIYAEGGGDTAQQKADLRQGLDGLLGNVKTVAREKYIGWRIICCGGRAEAYSAFMNALSNNSNVINILLVDSEGPVSALTGNIETDYKNIIEYLSSRDRWDMSSVKMNCVHLMVQCMEAWIVADPDALEKFYGQHFNKNNLPKRANLEEEPKEELYKKLEKATDSKKMSKGQYGKIKHASKLLQLIDPEKVAARCPRFALLKNWLIETINQM